MTTRKQFRIASWVTDCGCKINVCAENTLGMDYCPTHDAAPHLLKALRSLREEALRGETPESLIAEVERTRGLLCEIEERM